MDAAFRIRATEPPDSEEPFRVIPTVVVTVTRSYSGRYYSVTSRPSPQSFVTGGNAVTQRARVGRLGLRVDSANPSSCQPRCRLGRDRPDPPAGRGCRAGGLGFVGIESET